MGRRLYFLGAGAQAREAFEVACSLGREGDVQGFVEENSPRTGSTLRKRPILDATSIPKLPKSATFIAAIGTPLRRRFVASVEGQGRRFETLVDASARVGQAVELGAGSLVCQGAVLTTDVRVGKHVLVNVGSILHHDAVVEEFATIGPAARLAGGAAVEAGAWIGMGACILEGVTVGANAFVGAGAVVNRDIPSDTLAYGVPARQVRTITKKDWVQLA